MNDDVYHLIYLCNIDLDHVHDRIYHMNYFVDDVDDDHVIVLLIYFDVYLFNIQSMYIVYSIQYMYYIDIQIDIIQHSCND